MMIFHLLIPLIYLLFVNIADTSFFGSAEKKLNFSIVPFQNKCIGDLGCFYTGPPFYDPVYRPISLPPHEVETKFILFTPTHPLHGEKIKPTKESLINSSFDPNLQIKVLIHGYLTTLDSEDIRYAIKDALLNHGDYNVIVLDWTKYNGIIYPQTVANARVVGAQLAQLLKFIMSNTKEKPEDIHIIGHSLGAHIAGFAGKRIPNLGRITGLDAAGPYFHDANHAVCLDDSDAQFVDIIHTDGGDSFMKGTAVIEPVGAMDFYPNGGGRQPFCEYASNLPNLVGRFINAITSWIPSSCSHNRANEYFLESIDNSKCRFLAVLCTSYENFENGDCPPENSTIAEMGFHAKKIFGISNHSKFFLRTHGSSPYCIKTSASSVCLRNNCFCTCVVCLHALLLAVKRYCE